MPPAQDLSISCRRLEPEARPKHRVNLFRLDVHQSVVYRHRQFEVSPRSKRPARRAALWHTRCGNSQIISRFFSNTALRTNRTSVIWAPPESRSAQRAALRGLRLSPFGSGGHSAVKANWPGHEKAVRLRDRSRPIIPCTPLFVTGRPGITCPICSG